MAEDKADNLRRRFAVNVMEEIDGVAKKSIIPAAKNAGIVQDADGLLGLAKEIASAGPGFVEKFKDLPKQVGALMLIDLAYAGCRIARLAADFDSNEFDALEDEVDGFFHEVSAFVGYAGALNLTKMQHQTVSNDGAAARRRLGDQTRQKIIAAAMEITSQLTKEQAAPYVAEVTSKARSTVLRMLSEIFPGDAWASRHTKKRD